MNAEAPSRLLTVRELSKSFGGVHAVRQVSFGVTEGAATSLVGPNGAGKTTIFNLITGALSADAGSIEFRGTELCGKSPGQVARLGISRTFQDLRLFANLTVLENVMVAFQSQRGERPLALILHPAAVRRQESELRDRAAIVLERVGLKGQEHRKAGELSYAEQKLVVISRSIAMGADVWLLDEPSSGLDGAAVGYFMSVLKGLVEEGQTVVIVEHNLRVVREISDWVVFLDHGEVKAEGTADDIFSSRALQETYMAGGVG